MPKGLYLYLAIFFLTSFSTLNAKESNAKEAESTGDLKTEIKAYILHHLEDSHDFNLLSYKDKTTNEKVYIGMPLPVILWDDGLKIFSSSKLKHGKEVVQLGDTHYKLYHGKIYKTDAQGTITYDDHDHPTNIKPIDFSITKNVISILFTALLMFVLFRGLAQSYQKNGMIASGVGRFLEPIVLYVRDEIAIPNIGEKHHRRFMGYLLTLFFFIWFLNLLGLTPLGINVTGNIAITFCLAMITFVITTLVGKKYYWKHIFWMPGVPWPMKIILAPIELLGMIIKPFSLMIRLYANISAGHIVLMSLIALIFIFKNWIGSSLSFILAFSISIIEILVALLQAYIFTVLSALYFGFAVEEHDENDDH
ncbi:MAG: F0F1 ATP synthase subunit A [Flavobacteriaceae bacterium]|jgi:F-type H+-transporting ATPase subunit a|nr:F0F1 ATP synthase subunit A [Flavobacteriaceae bacterium]